MAGGRPTKYKKEFAEQAKKLCRLGATDKSIADFFDIAESTLNKWKKDHPEFMESLKEGKLLADAEVADKLYHRAIGYSHKEIKLAQQEGVFTDEKEVIKHYAPDPTAAIFWLKNRQPELWRDRPAEREVDDTPIGNIKIEVVGANVND